MRPVFLARGVEVIGSPKIVGKDHLRFRVRQNKNVLDAIGFGLGHLLDAVRGNGVSLDLVFSVDEHEWSGGSHNHGSAEPFPQLKIKDIRKNHEGR
jgi:hypothetical protein